MEGKQKRFKLDPLKDVKEGKLLVWDERDISLSKYRMKYLQERVAANKLKMDAETETNEVEDDEDDDDGECVCGFCTSIVSV